MPGSMVAAVASMSSGRIRARRHDAVQVGSIDGALAAAEALVVAGDLDPGMVDADLPAIDHAR